MTKLEIIANNKKLVALDIENGQEVYLPPELNQHSLPASFKYYDGIMLSLKDHVSIDFRSHLDRYD